MLHPHLQRQLRRVGIDDSEQVPTAAQWQQLLTRVSQSYVDRDQEEYLWEQTLSVSSREMQELLDKLRLASETRIAAERDKLRSLVSSLGAGLATLDAAGKVQSINAEGQRLLGWTEEELIGQRLFDRILAHHSEEDGPTGEDVAMTVRSGKFFRVEDGQFLRNGGAMLPVSYSVNPVYDDGTFAGYSVVFVDISHLKRVETALQRRDAVLEAVSFAAERFLRSKTWEENIADLLGRLGEATGVSRVYIFENRLNDSGNISMMPRWEWARTGIARRIESPGVYARGYDAAGFQRWREMLSAGRVVFGDTREFPEGEREMLRSWGVLSVIAVPILVGQEWWGFIGFDECRIERAWSSSEVDALSAAAGTIGAAIRSRRDETDLTERAQQMRQQNAVLAALNDTALDIMNQLDTADLLKALIERAGRLVGTEHGCVYLLRGRDNYLETTIATGIFRTVLGRPLAMGEGLMGRVWQSGTPMAVEDYQTWSGRRPDLPPGVFHAVIGVPLRSSNEIVGVLGLGHPQADRVFSQSDMLLLDRFAQLASIALDNARLYASAQTEIAERIQAAEALRRSQARNRALLDAIPDMMLRIDRDGRVVDYKPSRAVTELGDFDEVMAHSLWDIFSEDIARQLYYYHGQALETGDVQVCEYSVTVDDQFFEREARFVSTFGNETLIIVRDITERKKVDRLKNEFVSIVSHELRTPLTSIRGALGLLSGGVAGNLSTRAFDLIGIAYKNSERLVRLINDILDVEKIESGKMDFDLRIVSLSPLIEQAIEANRAYASQFGVTFHYDPPEDDCRVNADPDRLIQVLTNLLSNAAKFSPHGQTVTVGLNPSDYRARISVHDDGPGVPREFHDRIFQRFAQADASSSRAKSGTGLGLSIAKAIIERLGGQIGFISVPGAGTTFYFDLPVRWQSETMRVEHGGEGQPRILVCEDDPDIAKLLAMMLSKAGYEVAIALSITEARDLLATHLFDAMTLDLRLPDGNGLVLAREMRMADRTRHLPVVVVSVEAMAGREALNGDAAEIVDWLEKPIDEHRLISAVRRATQPQGELPWILHVEDDPDIRRVVEVVLEGEAHVVSAATKHEAHILLGEGRYDLVILDLSLPDGSGLDLLPEIRREERPIPLMLFTASDVGRQMSDQIAAALVKASTTNERLLSTIRSLLPSPDSVTRHSAPQPNTAPDFPLPPLAR